MQTLCRAQRTQGIKLVSLRLGWGRIRARGKGLWSKGAGTVGAWRLSSAFTQSPHLVGGGGRGRGEVMSSDRRQGEEAEKGAEEGEREGWGKRQRVGVC